MRKQTTLEILQTARAFLAPPGRWCRGGYTVLMDGSEGLGWEEPEYVQRACMIGAVRVACHGPTVEREAALETLMEAVEQLCGCPAPLPRFNDSPATTQELVLAVYDRAIELAQP